MRINMILECIGFAGTHTISSILRDMNHTDVSHGSRNFTKKTKIGLDDSTPQHLVEQLISSPHDKNYIIHTKIEPSILAPICGEYGIPYKILIRDPVKHINSCYKWAARKLLEGDPGIMMQIDSLRRTVIIPNNLKDVMPTALFFYSVNHVMNFNWDAIALGSEVVRMEDVLGSPEIFASTFCLSLEEVKAHKYFAEEKFVISSHSNSISDEILKPICDNKLFMSILDIMQFNVNGQNKTLADYKKMFGYS